MPAKTQASCVDVYHNILWSKYKGAVFSALYKIESTGGVKYQFVQIAESSALRTALSGVDLTYHSYPYTLLHHGTYQAVPKARLALELFRRVLTSQADLVILPGYANVEFWAMLLACLIRGRRRAVFVDSTRLDRPGTVFREMMKRLFFRLCDGFFCYGARSREYVISLGGRADRVFSPVHAPALPHDYTPTHALAQRLTTIKTVTASTFLYVGRLSAEKSLDVLIKAFALVHQQRRDTRLVLIGSGPQREELLALVAELGLAAAVDLPGPTDLAGVVQQYLSAHAMVLPSWSEPWGLVVNEALSYGCPVIVSDRCGCVPELVIEGRTGFSFEAGDVQGLAARMLAVHDQFTDTEDVARACINTAMRYTPEHAARRIDEGCRAILE